MEKSVYKMIPKILVGSIGFLSIFVISSLILLQTPLEPFENDTYGILIALPREKRNTEKLLQQDIATNLNYAFQSIENVKAKMIPVSFTLGNENPAPVDQGLQRIRTSGKKFRAKVVLWGEYEKNKNINLLLVEQTSNASFLVEPKEPFSFDTNDTNIVPAIVAFVNGLSHYEKADKETNEYIKNEDYKQALNDFDKCHEFFNNYTTPPTYISERGKANLFLFIGKVNFQMKEYTTAIEQYTKAIDISKTFPFLGAYNNRGITHYNKGEYEQAEKDYNSVLDIAKHEKNIKTDSDRVDIARIYNNRGNVYRQQKRHSDALNDYAEAITLAEEIYNQHKNDSRQEAETLLTEANNLLAEAYYNKGVVYNDLEEYTSSIPAFKDAIQKVPEHFKAHIELGFAYEDTKAYQEAIQEQSLAVRYAITLEEQVLAYNNLGLAYQAAGNYAEAITNFKIVIGKNPKYIEGYDSYASLLVTCPEKKYCNSYNGIQYAQRALKLYQESGKTDSEKEKRFKNTLKDALANANDYF